MTKKRFDKYVLVTILILIVLYVLLGNVPVIRQNPIVPGAIVAVNMIVIVLAGILFGKRTGMIVGFFGTLINAFLGLYTGSESYLFEFAAVIPHAIMGYSAGFIREKTNIPVASFSIIIGHVLNIIAFIILGIFSVSQLQTGEFWLGIGYETIFGIVSIIILAYLYKGICKKCGF